MNTEENKKLMYRFADEIFNKKNAGAVDDMMSDNYIQHSQGVPPGREGAKMFFGALLNAFPDIDMTMEQVLADEDKLAGMWRVTGTHQNELMGIPATGLRIHITGIDIFRVENGKLAEHWDAWDQLGMMQQLGVLPTQG